jgi:hypothetical protein
MALVYRNGRPYLYRSIRRDGRVTSEYRGSGEWTIDTAKLEALEREDRELARFEAQAKRERLEAVERTLVEYFERVEDLAGAALYAAGYHRPKREWRRRRERRPER